MSLHPAGRWHYEFIPGRPAGHQWRIADEDDDPIRDFATEKEAAEFVQQHNANIAPHPFWRYA